MITFTCHLASCITQLFACLEAVRQQRPWFTLSLIRVRNCVARAFHVILIISNLVAPCIGSFLTYLAATLIQRALSMLSIA